MPRRLHPDLTVKTIELCRDLTSAVRRGHPWLYDRAVGPVPAGARPGEVVRVVWRGDGVATGWIDPTSPLRVRVLARGVDGAVAEPAWATARAAAAGARRRACPSLADACDEVGAVRLIHGEADGMPGLVVDRYAATFVAVFDGAGAEAFWRPRLAAVRSGLAAAGFVAGALCLRRRGAGALEGDPPPPELVVVEHGARFEVDLVRGQKTGLFLDQRDNRQWLRRHAAGARVLNLFSYTGGFSLHAALGGAAHVTSVDLAGPAIAASRRNFALTGIAAGRHDAVAIDAFDFLADAVGRGRRWDVVVCDPPSFAPSAEVLERALGAYRRLNAAALAVVAPGGLLMSASCSSHVTEDALMEAIAAAGLDAGRALRLRHVAGAAADHPVLPGFPEGRYLKFLDYFVE